jgi:low temperature requirement protein LtrA
MVIIALGEGLLGTTAALGALVGATGWTLDAAMLGVAGVALPFGLWWSYFVIPSGDLLHAYRSRSFGWGYGHIPLFGAVVAVGAGLHAAAYFLEHHSTLSATGTLLTVAIPLGICFACVFTCYSALTRTLDPLHIWLIVVTAAVMGASVAMSTAGVSLPVTLLVLSLAPWVSVVGYEIAGHRHHAEVLAAIHDQNR